MVENLGRCDKKQYEHCGPHPQYPDVGQRLPPFGCVNWKAEPSMAENDAPELKPCPFCGRDATIRKSNSYFQVACDSCDVSMLEMSATAVAKAWNTRADLAAHGAAQDDLWSDLEVVVECIDIPLPQKDSIVAAIRRTQVKFADAIRQAQRETCVWSLDDLMEGDLWETDCGQAFQFNDDGPEGNHFKFCYYCGKPLEALRRTESDEVDEAAALRAEGKGEGNG